MQLGLGTLIALILPAAVFAQGTVSWSILPNARTGAPNEELTFLATISNSRDVTMTCQPRFGGFFTRPGGVSGRAQFFTYDGTTLGDTANAFVDIPAQSSQNYVVVLTVDRAYSGNVLIPIRCTDPDNVIHDLRRIPLVNDFQVVIEAGNPPDIVMIGDTLSNDGVARVGETGPRAALMTLAAVNIGGPATDFIVVPEVTGFSTLQAGYRPTICETDANGHCIGPEDTFVSVADWPTNEVRLFAVRLRVPPQNGVPNYPDQLRLRVRAAPEPDTTGLDRPADFAGDWNQLLDAMFGGYSSGVEARAQPPFDDIIAPVQQCVTQVNGDTGGEFARSGGFLLVSQEQGSGGPVELDGFLEFADGQFQTGVIGFFRPVQLEFPSESGAGTVSIAGGGTGTVQETDRAFPATLIAQNGDRGVRIHWDAQGGGLVDIAQAGSTRCAGAPPIPDMPAEEPNQARRLLAGFFGGGTDNEVHATPAINGESPVVLGEENGVGFVAIGTGDAPALLDGFVPHEPPVSGLTLTQIDLMYDASLGALRIANQAGYGGVFVPADVDTSGNTPAFRCGVMSFTGTIPTRDTPGSNQDGGVTILLPLDEDPDELGDGECIQ
ncbi:hypothetical protein [Hyphobacterium indicum]|uniref:hypothetical protein n=1 Tax=Hyphobacterium indicum TaxID=2162714 RepID=UPI000D651C70|nr:hypothetical protein [Hyphobacterium indicum]